MNEPQSEAEVKAIQTCIRRGSPFGSDTWTQSSVIRLGLERTRRPRGWPKRNSDPYSSSHYMRVHLLRNVDGNNKPRRWGAKFSLRSMFIVITLAAVYFTCWKITITQGVAGFYNVNPIWIGPGVLAPERISSPMPFIIECNESFDYDQPPDSIHVGRRRYYLWVFGFMTQLPIEFSRGL